MSPKLLYDDGSFKVSELVIATPHRLYPLSNASVRVRRDPLWAGVAAALLMGLASSVYYDLLTASELLAMAAFAVGGLVVGSSIALLAVDVPGHPRSIVFGRTGKIRAVYRAVLAAKFSELNDAAPKAMFEE